MRLQRGADGVARHVPAPALPGSAPRGRKKRVVPDPIKTSGESAAEQLRLFIERYERLDEEAIGIAEDKRDVLGEMKAVGYDTKAFKKIIARRKVEKHVLEEDDAILETYLASLGML